MNVKLRFALLFSFFAAIILLVSSATIYLLYYNYREDDFFKRVRAEGVEFNDILSHIKDPNKATAVKLIQGLHNNTLWDERLAVLDSSGKLINKLPDTLSVSFSQQFLNQIKTQKEIHYNAEGVRQVVYLYIPETQTYVMASGTDKSGISKLHNLLYILSAVFGGGLLLTGFVSFFFVEQAFKPLVHLSQQMQKTTELNMAERVDEGSGNDEIQQIAHSFNEMLERLHKAFESQKSFVHHASHELRTPLATMFSQTESAINKNLTVEGYKLVLASLKEDQNELIELTNSLLLLSQYEKIIYSNSWPVFRIDELLLDAISWIDKMFPDAQINLEFSELPEVEAMLCIRGNDVLLKSAFHNLIKNAYTYSVNKKVNIIVYPGKSDLKIHFFNQGPQIGATEKDKIMVPFFRGGNSMSKKGFGLGLSIVNRIISLHKGNVQYVTEGVEGNVFIVSMPIG